MSNAPNQNHWFACPQPNPEPETRLFLFPYAGGGPAAFGKWPAGLPGTVETWIAHYPGRGSRFNEPALNRVSTLVEGLSQAIQPLLEKPFVFFGHSYGAIVAFELAHQLLQQGLTEPQMLFISACGAPYLPDPHTHIHMLPDPEFLQSLQGLNGIPAEVVKVPELIELLLPTLRADFEAIESYKYTPRETKLHFPILAFGGLDDPRVSRERLEGWDSLTTANFTSYYFPGDHFFIHSAQEAIMASIASKLISSHVNH